MSYQKDRDEFIGVIAQEAGGPTKRPEYNDGTNERIGRDAIALARLILRNASTIQRCEEQVCDSEAADRDRVQCPAIKSGNAADCACECYRWTLWHTSRKWTQFETEAEALAALKNNPRPGAIVSNHCDTPRVQVQILRARQRIEAACKPWGIKPNFQGDPRGCCVKLLLPSGKSNSWGGAEDGYCVPVR